MQIHAGSRYSLSCHADRRAATDRAPIPVCSQVPAPVLNPAAILLLDTSALRAPTSRCFGQLYRSTTNASSWHLPTETPSRYRIAGCANPRETCSLSRLVRGQPQRIPRQTRSTRCNGWRASLSVVKLHGTDLLKSPHDSNVAKLASRVDADQDLSKCPILHPAQTANRFASSLPIHRYAPAQTPASKCPSHSAPIFDALGFLAFTTLAVYVRASRRIHQAMERGKGARRTSASGDRAIADQFGPDPHQKCLAALASDIITKRPLHGVSRLQSNTSLPTSGQPQAWRGRCVFFDRCTNELVVPFEVNVALSTAGHSTGKSVPPSAGRPAVGPIEPVAMSRTPILSHIAFFASRLPLVMHRSCQKHRFS